MRLFDQCSTTVHRTWSQLWISLSVSTLNRAMARLFSFPCIFETLFTMLHFTVIVMSRLWAPKIQGVTFRSTVVLNAILELLPRLTQASKEKSELKQLILMTTKLLSLASLHKNENDLHLQISPSFFIVHSFHFKRKSTFFFMSKISSDIQNSIQRIVL